MSHLQSFTYSNINACLELNVTFVFDFFWCALEWHQFDQKHIQIFYILMKLISTFCHGSNSVVLADVSQVAQVRLLEEGQGKKRNWCRWKRFHDSLCGKSIEPLESSDVPIRLNAKSTMLVEDLTKRRDLVIHTETGQELESFY